MTISINENKITEAIAVAINAEINRAIEEITQEAVEEAKSAIEESMREQLPNIVMQLHKMYSVEYHIDQIVIRVENKT